MTLKEFIHKIIEDQLGMLDIHIKMFSQLRDKADNPEYKQGVQDCINFLNESLMVGMSITDEDIARKERGLQVALETIMANKIEGNN